MSFLIHNDAVFEESQKLFDIKNRAFCYGDAVFETIRIKDGKPLFLEDHAERLIKAFKILKFKPVVELHSKYLAEAIQILIEKNGIEKGGRARLEVYRNEGGFYTATTQDASFAITANAIDENDFSLNEKGFQVDIYDKIIKPADIISNLKTTNKLPFVVAALHKDEQKLDDCFLLNEKGNLCESINANIFLIIDDVYYTPALSDGCIEGITRKKVIQILKSQGKRVIESQLKEQHLLNATEVFLTNAIQGIRWVGAFKKKRYFNKQAKWLVEELNSHTGVAKKLF